jgi:hypothetical protein
MSMKRSGYCASVYSLDSSKVVHPKIYTCFEFSFIRNNGELDSAVLIICWVECNVLGVHMNFCWGLPAGLF